jgi:uncharacterized membrane protein YpjA
MTEPPSDPASPPAADSPAAAVPFGEHLPPRLLALFDDEGVPPREPLPRYVAPLPAWLENLGLQLAWLVVAVNLLGTMFGFWYYGVHPWPTTDPLITLQLGVEPVVMWPFVPDSPVATLFIALSLASWKLDRDREWVHALAFFGCIKLGGWTPFVLLAFAEQFSYTHWAMYNFLFWSHLAMVLEAFVIHRYASFSVRAVAVALLWYGLNDVVDYFVPVVGSPHHTFIPAEVLTAEGVHHYVNPSTGEQLSVSYDVGVAVLTARPHDVAAVGAVALTVAATFLALSTRVEKLRLRSRSE